MKTLHFIICYFLGVNLLYPQPKEQHNLHFNQLAIQWDEAMPIGNGIMGALIWNKDDNLRLSLDRADLWDERKAFQLEQHNFKWVQEQVHNNTYNKVQQWGDNPYGDFPYPTKLPAAALSFKLSELGVVSSNTLDIKTAINTIKFTNGNTFVSYIHATEPIGYFEITGKDLKAIKPTLLPHIYQSSKTDQTSVSVVDGASLTRLGYNQGTLNTNNTQQILHQPTYDGKFYEVLLEWNQISETKLIGRWTISNNKKASIKTKLTDKDASALHESHKNWWKNYWSKSNVSIPDNILERQYYLEMYKLGSVARKGAPAITLQAVWTADNGGLPPWKGDFHNDLNTQLSYWPTYSGNRLEEAKTFTDWLWKIRPENKKYTKTYFDVNGLNIPGVLTLNGFPMGGWIQYALSPTVSAWTAHHFYWQWKYSMDHKFLKKQAYPYITEAATFLANITFTKPDGKRYLPLSASPEYNDNSITAWFKNWTNFDLALAHFIFDAAAEVNDALSKKDKAAYWRKLKNELPDYAINETGMLVAVDQSMEHSHRHMSPYMAIYPLGQLDINNEEDKPIIKNSLRHLEKLGTKAWVGYSFSWIASMHARAKEGEEAVSNLQKFATNFCSINSFHINGDQKGGQYSGFTYRPFTLEGNFAFAQGVHELLLQSKKGYIEVFPALPTSWKNVSFKNLRAEGGFVLSSSLQNGLLSGIEVTSETNATFNIRYEGTLKIKNDTHMLTKNSHIYSVVLKKGEKIILTN